MSAPKTFSPKGVIPAILLPFQDDLSIDEAAFRSHVKFVGGVKGISAITVNAHSTEVHACGVDEQRRVLEIAVEAAPENLPVVAGVYADGTRQAQEIARMATAAGASALLVFPSNTIGSLDGQDRPEMALTHFRAIAEATHLPLIAFQYAGPAAYRFDTLLKMVEEIPSIVAIKDWSPPIEHERNIRVLQGLPRPVNVLSTNSAWLMSSLAMGPKGLLSGSGSVIADLQVELFDAVARKDLAAAQAVNDRILPTAQAFYARPWVDMHNRMKEALVMLGRLPRAVVRPPLVKVSDEERRKIRQALADARLLPAAAA